ncbi:protein-glutamate O-methyltransferase CheR [Phormidium sp. LEGE 05292]|uniref:CheR family methyltransferase n=1 Tax=[Phormidium] sp. LEGE 05292 TaxID=767427 RepID=UPI00188182CE|nr:protein-glutamate O-methyltransferase CheR [Phormidium sp. LEGE 05292]MBE9229438.1 protein-glutamate O-methyltransferase CheR [Phormidium sp. LEGE 05292]
MLDFPLATITIPSLKATELEDLLIYLNQVQQVDLADYKRSSLLRRIRVRMQQVGVECYQDYFDHLQRQSDEVTHLLNTIFINLTCFFRDRPVWDYLENQVIPQIVANKASNEPIRVWSAGCASGEETYSLAMLLAEALGLEQFLKRVRIYGTDVDRDAQLQARRGYYSLNAVELIPPHLLERYFERRTDGYRWRSDLGHPFIFHLHNLIQTAPLPKIDLLVCRNMLMYLTPEAQIRALVRFHFSLRENGFLMLGQAEDLITRDQKSLFTCIDREVRLFSKVPDAHRNSRLLPIAFCS